MGHLVTSTTTTDGGCATWSSHSFWFRSREEHSHLTCYCPSPVDGWIHTDNKKRLEEGNSEERHAKSLVRCPLPIHEVLSLITMTIRSHLTWLVDVGWIRRIELWVRRGSTWDWLTRPQQWLVICFTEVTGFIVAQKRDKVKRDMWLHYREGQPQRFSL